ncbi:MAG TPA: BolA family protein [Polyangiaceae bacterium]
MEPTSTAILAAIEAKIPDASVEITSGGGGHYSLVVRSPAFRGRSMVESHRMVYTAIAPLMAGDAAPVHAIDTLRTIAS